MASAQRPQGIHPMLASHDGLGTRWMNCEWRGSRRVHAIDNSFNSGRPVSQLPLSTTAALTLLLATTLLPPWIRSNKTGSSSSTPRPARASQEGGGARLRCKKQHAETDFLAKCSIVGCARIRNSKLLCLKTPTSTASSHWFSPRGVCHINSSYPS
ncbi:hypothetical protein BDZ45DRAFT_84981 [Acephala macrosclerotiorum]|nr:hypothetical protein BDZ45DRAFT_84981 [Acephala macrosclerotiorum]